MLNKHIKEVSKPAVDILILLSRDVDPAKRASAIVLLGVIGDQRAKQTIIDALNDDDSSVKREAIYALANLSDLDVIEPLLGVLNDVDSKVRKEVFQALDYNPDLRALLPLIRAFRDPNDEFPILIKRAIWYINRTFPDGDVVKTLITALSDEDPRIRGGAARALAEIDDMQAVEPLIQTLHDIDAYVRANVAVALTEMRIPERLELFKQMAETFILDLQNPETKVRQLAATILEQIGDQRAVPSLLIAVRDISPEVRAAAISAITHLRDVRIVDELIDRLTDDDGRVRRVAAYGLGKIGDSRAVLALAEALNDESWVRTAALWALFAIKGEDALKVIVSAVKHPYEDVRRTALYLLGRLGGNQALEAIRQGTQDSVSSVRKIAQSALYRLTTKMSGIEQSGYRLLHNERIAASIDEIEFSLDEMSHRLQSWERDKILVQDCSLHVSEILADLKKVITDFADIYSLTDPQEIPEKLNDWASGYYFGFEIHLSYHLQELMRVIGRSLPEELASENGGDL